ncbi:MAG TPA: purine-binding chemotaxis protein CheW [Halanaerobiaceae bacterium]|nr:chemotaxis protein CheW [Bacillota bacterium]HHU91711.1 purine-binding chemotaxis protein CheW [Halanaerobiaceae bacterium]HOA40408.1 chemotaxis protein CheW [Halanaerobiales bacterium]HPZ62554.1 chemotaxis protein CheW [Halanaerobiales bacterium]HQD03150.1 chemotaxis protein CheW [Halanaerobiales bacterium]
MLSNFKNKKKTNVQQEEQQFVVFSVGKEKFGVDVNQIKQVIPVMETTYIPNSPAFVKGVINLRGDIIPIIDLAGKLSLQRVEVDEEKKRIIIVELKDIQNVGMLVDNVTEMIRIDADEISDAPDLVKAVHSDYIQGVAKVNNQLLILLNLNKVLTSEELIELGNIEF